MLNEKVSVRDQEICRLQVLTAGPSSLTAIAANYDQKTADDKLVS